MATPSVTNSSDIHAIRSRNRADRQRAEAVANVMDRLAFFGALTQMKKVTDERLKDQAEQIVAAVLALTGGGQ